MIPVQFSSLFWDSDVSKIDIHKHKKYIIERVLEFGDTESVRWLSRNYRLSDVYEVLDTSRTLSKKSSDFWRLVLKHTPGNRKTA
jgi:hypothetical protein